MPDPDRTVAPRDQCVAQGWPWRARAGRIAAALMVLGSSAAADAMELRGTPLLQRWSSEQTGAPPRHVAASHDGEGRLYVANQEGVLRFDGDRWELLRLPGRVYASALAHGDDDRIYVGGFDVFGRVRETPDGSMQFEDLGAWLGAPGPGAFGSLWQIIADAGQLQVRTDAAIDWLDSSGAAATAKTRSTLLPDSARRFAHVDGRLFGRIAGRGLVAVNGRGELADIPGGDYFAERGMVGALRQADRILVLGDQAFLELGAAGVRLLAPGPLPVFVRHPPNVAVVLADESVAVGTNSGYLLHFDRKLQLLDQFSIFEGAIEDLHIDAEQGLWVVGDGELVRLRLPAPWTQFGPAQGVRGAVYAADWYRSALWVAGASGLVRLRANAEHGVESWSPGWFDYEGYDLHGSAQGLLIAHRSGLLVLEGAERPRALLADTEAVLWLRPIEDRPDRVFAVGEHSVWLLAIDQGRWQLRARTELGSLSPSKVGVGDHAGELWFTDSRSVPQRWRFDLDSGVRLEQRRYAADAGLPAKGLDKASLFRLDGRMHVLVDGRDFVFQNERFEPVGDSLAEQVERPEELIVRDSPSGTFAQTTRELLLRAPGSSRFEPLRFDGGAVRGFEGIHPGADGVVRIATWTGLLQYQAGQPVPTFPPLSVQIQARERAPDGTLSPFSSGRMPPPRPLRPGHGLVFRFGVVTMDSGVEFRYRLKGLVPNWSEWRHDRDLTLGRPQGGEYLLEVEARTPSARRIENLVYPFEVERRFIESAVGHGLIGLAAVLALSLLVWMAVWWRTRRLGRATELLETRIAERTRELEIANRQLAELATEDSLTGILNRRALESGLAREWHRCLDQHRSIAVLMIDVDHFKQYNDRYGHLEGDVLLQRMANELQASHDASRELLARFGGEEFVLILPGTHLEEAQHRAEQLCQRLRLALAPITVSIGVAAQVPSSRDDPQQLLRRADVALYRAKRRGRNRVEVADD